MEPSPEITPGSIVQVNPERHEIERFGACLVVVTEVKPWGVQGYVKNAGSIGLAFIRLKWEDIEPTGGRAEWRDSEEAD